MGLYVYSEAPDCDLQKQLPCFAGLRWYELGIGENRESTLKTVFHRALHVAYSRPIHCGHRR